MKNKKSEVRKNEKGMTLLEVMISILILSLIAMTFLHVFLNAFDNSIKAQEITNYTYATQAKLEELRSVSLSDLITEAAEQEGNVPFDINGDGTDDCFMRFTVSPISMAGEWATGKTLKNPAFVYLLYIGDKVLVIAEGGDKIIYTEANVNPTIVLDLTPSDDPCSITVNGKTVNFDRASGSGDVGVSAYLHYKDFGYDSLLKVNNPAGHVYINAHGADSILDEFDSTYDAHSAEYNGIMNSIPFLFKLKVELFHEQDDAVAFFDMDSLKDISFLDIEELAENIG